jgi:CRP-like cAMP-binding protein
VSAASAAEGTPEGTPERLISTRDEYGDPLPVEERFLGIASALWNQVRSATLVADNDTDDGDKPCVLLLIKRKALEDIVKKSPKFYERQMIDFIDRTLPDILARNRLFRDRLFVDDVRDWPALVDALRGKRSASLLQPLRVRLDAKLTGWLRDADADQLDGAERAFVVEELNRVLTERDLFPLGPWPEGSLGGEARLLSARPRAALNDCETFRLNRLLLEAALPHVFADSSPPFPLSRADFQEFTQAIAREHRLRFGQVLKPDRLENRNRRSGQKGTRVFAQGDPADSLYLILTGMVRVSMDLPGGRSMVNNLEADAYFGESAVLDHAGKDAPLPIRSANVETLCHTTLLRLDRDILLSLFAGRYRGLGTKLKRHRQSFSNRDDQMKAGRLLPPAEPPLEIAERLVLTRNVLLIDMDQCTRCDQCVRGCARCTAVSRASIGPIRTCASASGRSPAPACTASTARASRSVRSAPSRCSRTWPCRSIATAASAAPCARSSVRSASSTCTRRRRPWMRPARKRASSPTSATCA